MSRKLKTVPITATITTGQSTTNSSVTSEGGFIKHIYVNAPDLDDATYNLSVVGPASGMTLFSKTGLTKNAKSNIVADANNQLLNIPAPAGTVIQLTETTNATVDRVFTIKLIMDIR